MLHVLLKRDSIEAQLQRRYMENGHIEAGAKIVMRVVFEQQTRFLARVDYKCHFCDAVNHLGAGLSIVDSLQWEAGCSIDCRVCKRRFQISHGHSSARRSTQSSSIDSNATTDTEMRLIRNFHVQQTSVTSINGHQRTHLNNLLQSIYGPVVYDHVRWEVYSQGPPNSLTWHTNFYIDDMNYGYASAPTRASAQELAAHQAYNNLKRERFN
ncbi:hypothetical protein EDB19DRAFT_1747218 [Suillus lakei]|nr:hypothetical protein EDB19DRAFT_1747218 [Suillus lakei]